MDDIFDNELSGIPMSKNGETKPTPKNDGVVQERVKENHISRTDNRQLNRYGLLFTGGVNPV